MWRTMTVTAYDVMSRVHLVLRVTEQQDVGQPLDVVLEISDDMASVGESDVREWTRDALLALAEDL